ncbi:MAG: exported protein of unknown function [Candidatus Saccharibacteria bacterium]|nr:exported protein of unknown function [Candidatus Saccharibacteria bacterium]
MNIKRLAVGVLVAIFVAVPAVHAFAFGPDRTTYTCNSSGQCVGADHVQFNSFTNNPVYGDERNFLTVRDADAGTNTYTDNMALTAGKTYVIRFYVHNNAQQDLSGVNNYVAHNTAVRVAMPSEVNGSGQVTGYISASNAGPGSVFDDFTFTSGSKLDLQYVAGSAKIRTNGQTDVTISDAIVGAGAPVGFSSQNGDWPGCFDFSGWVTLQVKAVAPPTPTPTPVTPAKTTPKALPNTGAGDVVGIFAGASAAGTAAHMAITARRNRR